MSKIPHQRDCYARWLRIANKAVNDYYSRALEPTGVAVVQFSILVNVGRMEPCGVCELAEAVELDYSTVARSIKPLIERGLLADESDGRSRRRCLALTDAGRQVVQVGLPLWEQAQQGVRELLGASGVERLTRTLARLETLNDDCGGAAALKIGEV